MDDNPNRYSDIGTRLALAERNKTKYLHSRGGASDFPTIRSQLASHAKLVVDKRESEKALQEFERENGPQPEYHSNILYNHVALVPINRIISDPNFHNTRLHIDPVGLTNLQDSIHSEGLKVPIIVVKAAAPGYYHVRAGFRRTEAVRNLGWQEVLATVLPADTPQAEEYWINIVENTSREKLSSYELALAAKHMRDNFGVDVGEFARKTSHSPSHISDLLGCLERLPEEVLQSWANNDRVPLSIYVKLSMMTPLEAVRNLRLWRGQHRIDNTSTLAEKALDKRQSRARDSQKTLTVPGIEKTQRLMVALQTSKLEPATKQIAIEIVEYIQGCRKRIEGVIHDGWRMKESEAKIEEQDFDLMMEDKIRQLQRENAGEPAVRRNDEDDL